MKPGLLEMERQVPVGSPDQQDRPVTNFAINFENLKTSPLTALPHHGIHRARNVTFAIFFAGRQILLAARRLVWTIWTYRALVNELDSLTEADFRDLGVRTKDAASVAWKEAWRRAAERYHPH
jgi:uncharacterized protein YjiS (DUF1127 family)